MPRAKKTRNLFRAIQANCDERDQLMQQLDAAFVADDFTPSERNHPFFEQLRAANQKTRRRRKNDNTTIDSDTSKPVDDEANRTQPHTQEMANV